MRRAEVWSFQGQAGNDALSSPPFRALLCENHAGKIRHVVGGFHGHQLICFAFYRYKLTEKTRKSSKTIAGARQGEQSAPWWLNRNDAPRPRGFASNADRCWCFFCPEVNKRNHFSFLLRLSGLKSELGDETKKFSRRNVFRCHEVEPPPFGSCRRSPILIPTAALGENVVRVYPE